MHNGNYGNVVNGNYKPVGFKNTDQSDAWIRHMGFDERYPHVKNPIKVGDGASSTAAFSAYYYCQPGLRVVWRGGDLSFGRGAGRSFSYLSYDPSSSYAARGSRRSYTA